MKNESMFFADYLASFSPPTLSIKTAVSKDLNVESLNGSDLLMVMYFAEEKNALIALNLLKRMFDDELNALEQLNHQASE